MIDPRHPIVELVHKDKRYSLEAYLFVFEALNYAQTELGMGGLEPSEEKSPNDIEGPASAKRRRSEEETAEGHHLTGQQLCEAIRSYALEQFGFMAKCVLNSWGVHCTGDFGEIVFNLIEIEQMKKTKQDRREDFDDVFDFDKDLQQKFRITIAEEKKA